MNTPAGYTDAFGFSADPAAVCERIGLPPYELQGDFGVDRFEVCYVGAAEQPLYGCDDETVEWANRLIDAQPERFGLHQLVDQPLAPPRPTA